LHAAGHGDESVEVGVPVEHLICRGGGGGRVGRVGDHAVDVRALGADVGEPVDTAAADDAGGTPLPQPHGEAESDAGGGAGDEDGGGAADSPPPGAVQCPVE
jgi:hypothetical protein